MGCRLPLAWLLVCALGGCATVPVVAAERVRVAQPAVVGPELELCVLYGERSDHPLLVSTTELSLQPWHEAIATIAVKHPRGLLVIDPAFGADIAEDLALAPPYFKAVFGGARGKQPLIDSLSLVGLEPSLVRWALLTHAHWDHAGALRDLRTARVLMSTNEWELVRALDRTLSHGMMKRHFEGGVLSRVDHFDFEGPPMLGFDASHDVLGDGTVIALPMPGHTEGSTAYLVRGQGGRRWLFIGDTAWALRGVTVPEHKNLLVRSILDADVTQVGEQLGLLHTVMAQWPDVVIVPAHDADALGQLPTCGR